MQSRGFALAVLFAINVLNFYDRQALGVVVEPIRKEFHLSDTQIGALSTYMTILYAIVLWRARERLHLAVLWQMVRERSRPENRLLGSFENPYEPS